MTEEGATEAKRIVRNHRLWEVYLINYADIAPSHVDRDADTIEHVLGRNMVEKLEILIDSNQNLPSPHHMEVQP
jgi:Mn-dependent DtxR family transcriptional regulator